MFYQAESKTLLPTYLCEILTFYIRYVLHGCENRTLTMASSKVNASNTTFGSSGVPLLCKISTMVWTTTATMLVNLVSKCK